MCLGSVTFPRCSHKSNEEMKYSYRNWCLRIVYLYEPCMYEEEFLPTFLVYLSKWTFARNVELFKDWRAGMFERNEVAHVVIFARSNMMHARNIYPHNHLLLQGDWGLKKKKTFNQYFITFFTARLHPTRDSCSLQASISDFQPCP